MTVSPVLSPIQALKLRVQEQRNDWATPLRENIAVFDKWTAEQIQPDPDPKNSKWTQRILEQGPWNEGSDPLPLIGAPALPMPVKVALPLDLAPFFTHLKMTGSSAAVSSDNKDIWSSIKDGGLVDSGLQVAKELYYGVEMCEFKKGVLYEDGRMDLCKMVVGPSSITYLMRSLESNDFVKHFLLGNNIIGPRGACAIADFVNRHPNRIETWYLAGNCIDAESFRTLACSWSKSNSITNIWLKRNPLGPMSVPVLSNLICASPYLRTLDLDQTELGDSGVAQLFNHFYQIYTGLYFPSLQNLYLNATGISTSACTAISTFLSHPLCQLRSLYLSVNPIGNSIFVLASGLAENKSLNRLALSSCGLSSKGICALLCALSGHPNLVYLDIGQSYATQDLGARFNYLDNITCMDGGPLVEDVIVKFIKETPSLRVLVLGTTALSHSTINVAAQAVLRSKLVQYEARSALPASKAENLRCKETSKLVRAHLFRNVQKDHSTKKYTNYAQFEQGELRWLRSPSDARKIDSVYRNRDAAKARRGEMVLRKLWEVQDGNLEELLGV